MIRILIADDHDMIRAGLRKVLEVRSDWTVCGEAVNGREAVDRAKELKPDVVVLDFAMPELNGLEVIRQIRAALPHTEVLILTMHESDQLSRAALAAGARGFVLKSDAGQMVAAAVEQLSHHRSYFTASVSQMVLQGYLHTGEATPEPAQEERLTTREREVAQLIAEGRSSKEVADTLGISVKTAETHRANLMRKLELHSVSELVHYAIRNRIVEP
jgi:DNA-binding NarL/FixJ family response regulator